MSVTSHYVNLQEESDDKINITTEFEFFKVIYDIFKKAVKDMGFKKPIYAISHYEYRKLNEYYKWLWISKRRNYNFIFEPKQSIKNIDGFPGLILFGGRDTDVWFLIKYFQKVNLKELHWNEKQLVNYINSKENIKIYNDDRYGFYSKKITTDEMLSVINLPKYTDHGIGSHSSTNINKLKIYKDDDGNLFLKNWTEVWD